MLSEGGVANATEQDAFCRGTYCNITIIYDQSGMSNHLTGTKKEELEREKTRERTKKENEYRERE